LYLPHHRLVPRSRQSLQDDLAAVIRAERIKQRLTQEEVAHAAGLALNYVSELERARRNPSLFTIFRLAEALGVSADALIRRVVRR
jgi:transcriptional regulator with XRE-family HTH domain